MNFSPAMSEKAQRRSKEVVKSWQKEVKPTMALTDLAKLANPVINGWINYFGNFCASEMWSLINYIEMSLMKWGMKKYDKLKQSWRKAKSWL